MSRLIQVFEHEKLTLNKDSFGRFLHTEELSRLYQYNDNNKNIYFTGIRNGIKLKSYVGVIQIGGLTLEILPKAHNIVAHSLKQHGDVSNRWQKVLLYMLRECKLVRLDAVSEANLNKRYNSILDIYFEIFLDEVETLIKHGLIKKYQKNQGNVNALKGQLIFNKHIERNLIHQEQFYTKHEIYDSDHLINQILKRALLILKQISANFCIKDRISRINMDLPTITEVAIKKHDFERIPNNRKTQSYKEALKIAKMIILNYSPDIKNGHENMLALLFDMNALWEEYIYRMLVKSKPEDTDIKFQDPQHFWETRTVKPDIVIERNNENGDKETIIIDTKWRIPENNQPADNELKQMYVYNMYWNAPRSILLYPELNPQLENFGSFHKGRNSDNYCKVAYVSIFNSDGSLNGNIGEVIFKKLNHEYQSKNSSSPFLSCF
jgi:5-methylcytosine-specific restriction enzyme subunit McrC